MSDTGRSRRLPGEVAQVTPLYPATRLLRRDALETEQLADATRALHAAAIAERERMLREANAEAVRIVDAAEALAAHRLHAAQAAVERVLSDAEERGRTAGCERMTELLGRLGSELRRHNSDYVRDVAGTAHQIAKAVLDVELAMSPERIRNLVQRAVARIRPSADIVVRLSRRDADFVRADLPALEKSAGVAIAVREDNDASVGSVVIETARGSYEASIAAQLEAFKKRIAGTVRSKS